jgi:Holliday junction resolvase RusA-like endonuclease
MTAVLFGAGVPPVELTVYGTPVPQGSKTANYRKGPGGRAVPDGTFRESNADRLRTWRDAITAAGLMKSRGRVLFTVPVFVVLIATVPRPKTGPWAVAPFPGAPPDTDKLQRAVGDALTAGRVIADDALIVWWEDPGPRKVFPGDPVEGALSRPGVFIRVREAV